MCYFDEVEDYDYYLEEAKFQRDNIISDVYNAISDFIIYAKEVGFDSVELKQAVIESFNEMPKEMSGVLQEDFNISSVERFIEILKIFNRETEKDLIKYDIINISNKKGRYYEKNLKNQKKI